MPMQAAQAASTSTLLGRGASALSVRAPRRAAACRGRAAATRASHDAFDTAEAPGEGKRRRPSVTDSTDGEDAVEPRRGPQTHSRGVATEDAADVSHAYEEAEAPFSAWPKPSDAPGEGKKKAPGVAEHADTEGKPARAPPRGRRREPTSYEG